MDAWDWVWTGWLGLFAVLEGVALVRGRGTLSEKVWKWFRIRRYGSDAPVDSTGTTRVLRFLPIALLVWLTIHIATGGWV